MRRTGPSAALLVLLVLCGPPPAPAADWPAIATDAAAVARGKEVFSAACASCHGLRYLGQPAPLPEDVARAAFGKAPPDLSLTALARGRERKGAAYIAALLAAYVDSPEKNTVYPGIAMPPPLSADDPDLRDEAADVAAYLLFAADPHAAERRRLGRGVLAYLGVLATLLFLVNRRTWSGLRRAAAARGGDRPGA